jgi:hypothetical protein
MEQETKITIGNECDAIALNNLIDNECCVCLDTVDMHVKGSVIKMKCCLQSIHKACFLEWAGTRKENTSTCLICRTVFGNMLNYVSLEDVLTYTDSHKHTIDIFNYALGNIFMLHNINICIVDSQALPSHTQYEENITRLNILRSKLSTFIICTIIIMLFLISIISHYDECSFKEK